MGNGELVLNSPSGREDCILFKSPSLLSNLSPVKNYVIDNKRYTGVEQYYQSKKFPPHDRQYYEIMNTNDPFKQMRLGKGYDRKNGLLRWRMKL